MNITLRLPTWLQLSIILYVYNVYYFDSLSIPIKFEDTKGVIRSRKSKKNTQCNAQKDKQ